MTFVAPTRRSGAVVRDPRPDPGRPLETEYRPRHPLDVARTLLFLRRGANDPTMTVSGWVVGRAPPTPEGIATLAIRETSPGVVRGAAWGPGREWALAQLPDLCGAADDPSSFDGSRHPLIAESHRRNPGLRLART